MAASYATEWFLSEPWDPVPERRGDPLGFRAVANHYADVLVPDLSNRTSDARWFSLLSWCLWLSDQAPWPSDGVPNDLTLNTRAGAAERYGWLRPLELLWVARTHELCGGVVTGRQLPGITAVKRWLKSADSDAKRDDQFSMTQDQWARYRNTGIYGAYRVALRRLPGMTKLGNGWTPGDAAETLKDCVNANLGRDAKILADFSKTRRCDPVRYWIKKWERWPRRTDRAMQMLPHDSNVIELLHDNEERSTLAKVLFESGAAATRRRIVARLTEEFEAASPNGHHADLCAQLAGSLAGQGNTGALVFLEAFTRFADAGMDVLNAVWRQFSEQPRPVPSLSVASVLKATDVAGAIARLRETAEGWRSTRAKHAGKFVSMRECDNLAEKINAHAATDSAAVLSALIEHHLNYGGGKRWMKVEDNRIIPLLPTRGLSSTPYRFRLWQVCRLATQCGVIAQMPENVLEADAEEDDA